MSNGITIEVFTNTGNNYPPVQVVQVEENEQPIIVQTSEYYAPVQSVNGQIGFVVITKESLGITGGLVTSGDLSNYATIINLASTGSTLAANLASSGSTLSTNIINLSENVVFKNGDQTINGIKTFSSRPLVNETGVLLIGEIPALPINLVYTDQDQFISGQKTFLISPNKYFWVDNETLSSDHGFLYVDQNYSSIGYHNNEIVFNNSDIQVYGITNFNNMAQFINNGGILFVGNGDYGTQLDGNRSGIKLNTFQSPTDITIRSDFVGGNTDAVISVRNQFFISELFGNSINSENGGFGDEIVIYHTGSTYGQSNSEGPFIRLGKHNIISEKSDSKLGIGILLPEEKVHISGGNLRVEGDVFANNLYTKDNPSGFITGIDLSNYATVSNLQLTGKNLNDKINSLSGVAVLIYGDQIINGTKRFNEDVYIKNLFVTGTETIVNTTNFNVQSPYLILNLTGGAVDGGIFFVTGAGLTGINDYGPIIGFDHSDKFKFGIARRSDDLSTLNTIAGISDITNYSGFANNSFYPKNNPSGFITGVDLSSYATVTNLALTGSGLDTKINSLSGTLTGNYVTKLNGQFTNRPTVNGTGVLLSGEGGGSTTLPDTILYTSGSQIISGNKIFTTGFNFSGTSAVIENISNQAIELIGYRSIDNSSKASINIGGGGGVSIESASDSAVFDAAISISAAGQLNLTADQQSISITSTHGNVSISSNGSVPITAGGEGITVNTNSISVNSAPFAITNSSNAGLELYGYYYDASSYAGIKLNSDGSVRINSASDGTVGDQPIYLSHGGTNIATLYSYQTTWSSPFDFLVKPTVNGSGVLLEGDGIVLPNTIVYTTGDQIISGIKTFFSPITYFGQNSSLKISDDSFGSEIGLMTSDDESIAIKLGDSYQYGGGQPNNTPLSILSGKANFTQRPTVNNSEVALTNQISKIIDKFTASSNQPPATAFATLDTRSSVLVLDYDDTVNESGTFVGMIPETAGAITGLRVRILWTATTATGNNCRWGARFADLTSSGIDAPFAIATEVNSAANSISGRTTTADIVCSGTAGLAANEFYRLLVYRNSADTVNDTMAGDAELISVTTYLT